MPGDEMSDAFREYLRALSALCLARAAGCSPDAEADLAGDVYDAEMALTDDEHAAAADCAWQAWPDQVRERWNEMVHSVPRARVVEKGDSQPPREAAAAA